MVNNDTRQSISSFQARTKDTADVYEFFNNKKSELHLQANYQW